MANTNNHFSPFHSYFNPRTTTDHRSPAKEPPSVSGGPTHLATSLYYTGFGLFTLTWSNTFLGHSLHLHLDDSLNDLSPPPLPTAPLSLSSSTSFLLHIKPFAKKHGFKKVNSAATTRDVEIFWDFRRSKFGSGPEPESGFYLAVVISGEMALLIGDSTKAAYRRTRVERLVNTASLQALLSKTEHVSGNRVYVTKARFGGRNREIKIEQSKVEDEDSILHFSIDSKMVLEVKHLKWKFRGNKRIEIDNFVINISWDVYNWLFEKKKKKKKNGIRGHAAFTFKFEKVRFHGDGKFEDWLSDDYVLDERVNMKRNTNLSSSSISSSASSGCNSVEEWETVEEKELESSTGFSLLVYAWTK